MDKEKFVKIRTRFELFLFYCMAGWLYEVIWCNMIDHNRGFINNGFLLGPWLPIYGFGTSIIMLVIYKYGIKENGKVFLTGAIFSTIAELIGSYFLEIVAGKSLWNYSSEFMNFQGRIALKPSINFGLLILIAYLITPKLKKLFVESKISEKTHNTIFIIFAALFATDVLWHLANGSNI